MYVCVTHKEREREREDDELIKTPMNALFVCTSVDPCVSPERKQ